MREEMIFDNWMKYDEDGFYDGLREDAPQEVKEAYEKYLKEKNK